MHRRYRCVPTDNLLEMETLQVDHAPKWSRERSREASACVAFSVGKLVFLFVLSLLFACDQGGEVERLTATAEESEKAGQLQVVTDLYHRAAAIRSRDFFAITYRAILPDLPVDNCIEAAAHVRKIKAVRSAFAPAHFTLDMAMRLKGKHAEGRQERHRLEHESLEHDHGKHQWHGQGREPTTLHVYGGTDGTGTDQDSGQSK